MGTRIWCVALAFSCLGARAGAQVVLSEREALARFSVESPRARAIRAGIEVARADVLAAGRWPNPRVTFDREAVAGVTENMAMVSQVLSITGRRALEKGAASALLSATSSRADDELRRARADLRIAFGELVAAQTRERDLTQSRDRLRELVEILARRESAGDAAGFDRLRAEREGLDIDADLAIAAADRARAQATLAGFFSGAADPSLLVAAGEPPRAPDLPPIGVLVERAEAVRGDLKALLQDAEAARFAERAAARRIVPEPEVVAGTKSSSIGGGPGSVITVHVSVPLFDRAKPEQIAARARGMQAEARAEAFRIALGAQIAALRATAVQRREAANRYREAVATGIGDIERIAQISYDAGERSILELLDAFRTTSTARVRQSVLDFAARQAEIELEFVSGWEIP
jgi:cobalt-zinc-cadmium efflux system outer membrane protein